MHAAVFVDFENLFLSLKNREELTGHRIRDLCLSILEHLKQRLNEEKAPMVLGRSSTRNATIASIAAMSCSEWPCLRNCSKPSGPSRQPCRRGRDPGPANISQKVTPSA